MRSGILLIRAPSLDISCYYYSVAIFSYVIRLIQWSYYSIRTSHRANHRTGKAARLVAELPSLPRNRRLRKRRCYATTTKTMMTKTRGTSKSTKVSSCRWFVALSPDKCRTIARHIPNPVSCAQMYLKEWNWPRDVRRLLHGRPSFLSLFLWKLPTDLMRCKIWRSWLYRSCGRRRHFRFLSPTRPTIFGIIWSVQFALHAWFVLCELLWKQGQNAIAGSRWLRPASKVGVWGVGHVGKLGGQ